MRCGCWTGPRSTSTRGGEPVTETPFRPGALAVALVAVAIAAVVWLVAFAMVADTRERPRIGPATVPPYADCSGELRSDACVIVNP